MEVRGRGCAGGLGDENGGAAHAAPREVGGVVVGVLGGGRTEGGVEVLLLLTDGAGAQQGGGGAKSWRGLRCGVQSGMQSERRCWSGRQVKCFGVDVNSSSEDRVKESGSSRGVGGLRWWCRWTGRRAGDDGWASFETLS